MDKNWKGVHISKHQWKRTWYEFGQTVLKAPSLLCWVLGPSLQERYWVAEADSEKGRKAGEGCKEQLLWGMAEGTAVV